MARYRCTGRSSGITVACDFTADTRSAVTAHFEEFDHDVEQIECHHCGMGSKTGFNDNGLCDRCQHERDKEVSYRQSLAFIEDEYARFERRVKTWAERHTAPANPHEATRTRGALIGLADKMHSLTHELRRLARKH